MAVLDHLPNEILIHVLRDLRAIDLQTFLVCQAASRRFRILVQDLLLTTHPGPEPEGGWGGGVGAAPSRVHPLLASRFKGLFDTVLAFNADDLERQSRTALSMYLSLQGDYLLPFRRLPWAQSDRRRASGTLPEASWRRLSVTEGRTPITHLDIVKDYAYEGFTDGGDTVQYSQLELPLPAMTPESTPYLTMGMLYDLLLSEHGTYQGDTGAWELLLDRRLRSFDILDDYECFIKDDPQLVEVGGQARGCAILHVQGGEGCENAPQGEGTWEPTPIGEVPRCLPWQGPRQDLGRMFVLME